MSESKDAEAGIQRTLRPFDNFEEQYQGSLACAPILLTENGKAFDELAGEPGYDPNLVKGIAVPFGSRIALKIPLILWTVDDFGTRGYRYRFMWRDRNTADWRRGRKPAHVPQQSLGFAKTVGPNQGPRVFIPAADNSVVYVQPEAAVDEDQIQHLIMGEEIEVRGAQMAHLPRMPNGQFGVIQQGVFPAFAANQEDNPGFCTHELQAVGDELIIAVTRELPEVGGDQWDFAVGGVDRYFSAIYGDAAGEGIIRALGVEVFIVTAP